MHITVLNLVLLWQTYKHTHRDPPEKSAPHILPFKVTPFRSKIANVPQSLCIHCTHPPLELSSEAVIITVLPLPD